MYFFIPLAYEPTQNGQGYGSARANALINKADQYSKEQCTFVSRAGHTKQSVCRPTKDVPIPLCEQLKEYVLAQLPGVTFSAAPAGWGTYEEVRYALQHVLANQNKNGNTHIFFATNFGHMLRVQLALYHAKHELGMTNPTFKYHFICANHSFSIKEYGQETIKCFTYLYKIVFNKPMVF